MSKIISIEPTARNRVQTIHKGEVRESAWLYVAVKHLKDIVPRASLLAGRKEFEFQYRLCVDGTLHELTRYTSSQFVVRDAETARIKCLAHAVQDLKGVIGDYDCDEAWLYWSVSIISENQQFLDAVADGCKEGDDNPFPFLHLIKEVNTLLVSNQDAEKIRQNERVQIKGERTLREPQF